MQFCSRIFQRSRWALSANQNAPLKWKIHPFMLCRFHIALLRSGAPLTLVRAGLVVLHLSLVGTVQAAQGSSTASMANSRPYLATHGSTALRFIEEYPVKPLVRKPVASGPPVAASAPAIADVALANDQAAASTPPMPLPDADSMPSEEPITELAQSTPGSTAKVHPILPDDTRRQVQAQDFLPLFRLPASGSLRDADVIMPASSLVAPTVGTQPASSATYRQE
jgi:hypothetical protein